MQPAWPFPPVPFGAKRLGAIVARDLPGTVTAMELHRALGSPTTRRRASRTSWGCPPQSTSSSPCTRRCGASTAPTSRSRLHLRRAAHRGPPRPGGPGRERRRGRRRRRHRRGPSHRVPQPSVAVEPYQGAATGVGGILRDIFTMGARPIALMDPLFFGPLDDARCRWLTEGVVAGISGYGNSWACPPWAASSPSPPLRPQPARQRARPGRHAHRAPRARAAPPARATWPCSSGSTTGRDGIGGVSVLASAGFGDGRPTRPSAPACRWATPSRRSGSSRPAWISRPGPGGGHPGPGGAGLACATSETPAGRVGMDVDVDAVPRREPAMEPFEVMTSRARSACSPSSAPSDPGRGGGGVPALGGAGHRHRHRHRPGRRAAAHPRRRRAPCWPTCPPPHCPTTPPSTTAPAPPRPGSRAAGATTPPPSMPLSRRAGADLLALLADTSWVYRQYDALI